MKADLRSRTNVSFEGSRSVFEKVRSKCIQLAIYYGSMFRAAKNIGISESTFSQWVNEEYKHIPARQSMKLLDVEHRKVSEKLHPNANEEIYNRIRKNKETQGLDKHLLTSLRGMYNKFPMVRPFPKTRHSVAVTQPQKVADFLKNPSAHSMRNLLNQFENLPELKLAVDICLGANTA